MLLLAVPKLLVSSKAGTRGPHLWERRPRSFLAPGCRTGPGQQRRCGAAPVSAFPQLPGGRAGRRRLRPLPCPLPGPLGSEGRGLGLQSWGLRVFSAAAAASAATSRSSRPRSQRSLGPAAECPWTRISSPSSCFLGQPKPQVRTSAVEVAPRACGSQRPPGLLLLSSLLRKPRGSACSGDAQCSPSPESTSSEARSPPPRRFCELLCGPHKPLGVPPPSTPRAPPPLARMPRGPRS